MAVDCYSMFPPGYCFAPNDVELIECYLKPKVNGCFNHPPGRIYEVNIYEHSPQQLIEKHRREGEKVTYFFSLRNRKYPKGSRPDRAVGDIGFWKATGKDIDICWEGRIIGYKKALVYYTGTRKNPIKTSWLMHEFRLNPEENSNVIAPQNLPSTAPPPNKKQLDDCVLCKIYDKTQKLSGDKRKYAGEELQVEVPLQSQQNGEHFQAQPLSTTIQNPAMPTGYLKNGWNHDLSNSLPPFPINIELEQPEALLSVDSMLTMAPSMPPMENGWNYDISNPLPPFPNNMEVEQLEALLAADSMLTMAASMPPVENGWNYDFSNPLPPFLNNMEVEQPEALSAADSMLTMAASMPPVENGWNYDFSNPLPPFLNNMEVEQPEALSAADSMLTMASSMPPMENGFMLPMTMDSVDHLIDYSNIADIISEYEAGQDKYPEEKEPFEFYLDDPSLVQLIQSLDDPSPPKDH